MIPIHRLSDDVLSVFPETLTSLDAPKDPVGRWFLDLTFNRNVVTVEWQATEQYFGVSLQTGRIGYGERPNWVSANYYKTFGRVLYLLTFGHE